MKNYRQQDIDIIQKWLGNGSINVFGLPFSGKDTHGSFLAEKLNAQLLGGGDILRHAVIPSDVKNIMDAGNLIPTEAYMEIVLPFLAKPEFKDSPIVLSSVGRWHGEEAGVVGACRASGHPIKAVIYLDISPKVARERFIRSQAKGDRGDRRDDSLERLERRFQEFTSKTLPVIAYYAEHSLLIDIDGNPPVDEVRQVIIDELLKLAHAEA